MGDTGFSRRAALAGGLGVALAAGATTTAQAAPVRRLRLPANPRVLLMGDSYTEGAGAVPASNGYAFKIGAPLGWVLTIDGKGGSGYCNPTAYGAGVYNTRLAKYPADGYDLVVLQGGSNDEAYDSATLQAAVTTTLRTVRTRYPRARTLVLGPANPYGTAGADRVRVNDLLAQAAAARALPYINTITEKWFLSGDGSLFANPDNGHPNNAGHAHIRSLFVRDVQSL